MIKTFFTLFFFCLTIPVMSQNITGEIKYSCSLNNNPFAKALANKKKMDTTPQHIIETHKKFVEQSVAIDYVLKFNSKESIFTKIKTMSNDVNKGFNLTAAMGANGVFYTNVVTQERFNKKNNTGQAVIVEGQFNNNNWQLTKESKLIGNLLCYKATSEYKYMAGKDGKKLITKPVIAWFTNEIPVGFGPAGYGNLPGLIVDLQVGDITYIMTKVKLNPKKEIIIKKPKLKGERITEKQYNGF